MNDIKKALDCGNIGLKDTFKRFFHAVGVSYFDNVYNKLPGIIRNNIKVRIKNCGIEALVNQIYSTINSASQLVNLLEETSKGIAVIQMVIIYVAIHTTLNNYV